MGKNKKKKKDKNDLDGLIQEYTQMLEMTKAKNEQLDGLIREVRLYLSEIKEIRDGLSKKDRLLDDE